MKAAIKSINAELIEINRAITAHKYQIENLKAQRHKLYEKLQDLDMDIVLQIITEKGLSSNDILKLINNYADML